ncbi:MAG: hypothetical protein HY736_11635 [Verrucomicrobia bacterium]|nr:hypothetical protein [Verrucomicrobiota bacterium]
MLPSQNRVTATWPDGSVKWLYLDFMLALSAGGAGNYTVAYGDRVTSMPSPAAVQVRRSPDGLEVNTGAIRFLVSATRFGLVENVRLASGQSVQREPIGAEIVEAGGRVWRALDLPVTKLEVEQSGPLHAVRWSRQSSRPRASRRRGRSRSQGAWIFCAISAAAGAIR